MSFAECGAGLCMTHLFYHLLDEKISVEIWDNWAKSVEAEAALLEGDVALVADDDVIQEFNIEQLAGLP